jgi:hypothetical protein
MKRGRGEDEDFGFGERDKLAQMIHWLYRVHRPTKEFDVVKKSKPPPDDHWNPPVVLTLDQMCELVRCWITDLTQTMDDAAIEFHRDVILHCEKRIAMHEASKAGVDLEYGKDYP